MGPKTQFGHFQGVEGVYMSLTRNKPSILYMSLTALEFFAVGQFAIRTVRLKKWKNKKNLTEPNLTNLTLFDLTETNIFLRRKIHARSLTRNKPNILFCVYVRNFIGFIFGRIVNWIERKCFVGARNTNYFRLTLRKLVFDFLPN